MAGHEAELPGGGLYQPRHREGNAEMAITHIDHVLIAVNDLDEAARVYRNLGFFITGGGEHPGRGTANRLAVLDPEYLELIGVRDRNEAWPDLVEHLDRFGPGLYNFALASDDLEADLAAFRRRAGEGVTALRPEEPWDGTLVTPGGRRRSWRAFRVAGGRAVNPFIIQHDSEGEEKRQKLAGDEELQPHPLQYGRISRLSFAFPTLEEGVAFLRDGYGLVPEGGPSVCVRRQADRVFIPLKQGMIEVIAPQRADSPVAPFVAERGYGVHSISVTVPDVARTADQLEARGVAVSRLPNGTVLVDPAHTLGVRLQLVKE